MSGVAMQRSKLIDTLRHLLDQVFRADDVGTGGLGLLGLGALGEDGDALRAARAVRQVAHAADHLVGVLGIDAEVHRDLDGFVELGLGAFLDDFHGLVDGIELVDGRA